MFSPIAIVGHACLLPGADSPEQLWAALRECRSTISPVPEGRWRADRQRMLRSGLCSSDAGGFVGRVDPEPGLEDFDPLVHWLVRVGRQSLKDAGMEPGQLQGRAGAIVGNLAYPTESLVDLAQSVYLPETRSRSPHPLNRFSSGLPVDLLCRELGLAAGGYALDAACASSLYAIKLASDWLHRGRADVMLAGGINRVDSLLIHSGFTALRALSPTGRSRPFHRDADGLVPAEGAALLVLKRLEDAEAGGDRILGVIRGIGLSNDGRGSGLLTPSLEGQVRAMKAAYAQSGLDPGDVSLIECHATGTAVGDSIEIQSMAEVFAGHDIPIGSLKSNLGHLITASGAAGIVKVIQALRHGVRPATLNAAPATAALDGTPFRLLDKEESWERKDGVPRLAALNSFGFGGNNAHLLLQEHVQGMVYPGPSAGTRKTIAVVGLAARAGSGESTQDFVSDFLTGRSRIKELPDGSSGAPAQRIQLPAKGLIFPPRDLERTLAQQNLLLEVALESLSGVKTLTAERTSVLVGMQCDVEATRAVLRLALPDIVPGGTAPAELRRVEDAMDAPLDAARVVGCMPNIPANRLNRQFGLGSGSFTVAAEELSGVRALDIAIDWLAEGEIDAAVVGASDLCVEPVHRSVMKLLGEENLAAGDGACVLVLKRLDDAVRDNETIRAIFEIPAGPDSGEPDHDLEGRVRNCFGHVHAASGLLQVAAASAWLDRGAMQQRIRVGNVVVVERSPFLVPDRVFEPVVEVPRIHTYDVEAIRKLSGLDLGFACRLALVATTPELPQRLGSAIEYLRGDRASLPEGAFFRRERLDGEIAFVFTGAAAAYHGMGRDLILALPQLLAGVKDRCKDIGHYAGWIYRDSRPEEVGDFRKLCGSSFLSQAHFEFTRKILGIAPQAAIGLSSGETNSLYAFGAWQEMHALLRDLDACGLYTNVLGGRAEAVRQAWAEQGIEGTRWTSYWVSAPREDVEAALQQEPAVRITIINSENDVVIGGEADACQRVASRIGVHRAAPMGTDLAVHGPEVRHAAPLWRSLHHRPTAAPSGVRFYSNALGHAYELTADAVADALTGQALQPIDFPRTIRRAYEDGVRVFIEHGPRAQCTKSIRAILGDLPHVAVAMDGTARSPVQQAMLAAAELWTAGVEMDLENLRKQLGLDRQNPAERPAGQVIAAHPPLPLAPSAVSAAAPGGEEVFVLPAAPRLAALLAPDVDFAPAPPRRKLPAVAAMHASISEAHREHMSQLAVLDQEYQSVQARLLQSLVVPAKSSNVPQRTFTRKDLEVHASGLISSIFGSSFAGQDRYTRQVRMPEPPLLLADRVTSLHGEPGSMGRGRITTETDVIEGAWYLHHGRMPAGITIESGQADLMLISWLGVDALNQGERAYRLLGCELSFSGSLPRIGETLRYDIEVDGHASHGAVRMFFFHYDCTVAGNLRLRVRDGQAGFFTDAELAASEGVLWSADSSQPTPRDRARLQAPPQVTTLRSFDETQARHFAEGRPADCFGAGFERAFTHTRSPRTQSGGMQLLHRVPVFEPSGGPWQRGYLRAEWDVRPDDWFFQGHFKADPCMPGTLMFEACLQAMAFHMGGLGMTLGCDGWRFEPVPDETYTLRCRGQVLPTSKQITYEVFVDEVIAGPMPTVFADVLCTVDGLKAFHCARLGLRLVPDWPLEEVRSERSQDVPFDQASLMSCALGRPSNAFGENFTRFDGPIRVPRLPGPPYHFMSRVVRAERAESAVGAVAEVEYDVPAEAWYFSENGHPVMPVSVLTEVLLQPCGWLASYAGTWLDVTHDIFFRNLDGGGVVHSEIRPDSGVVRTRTALTSCSRVGAMTITAFTIVCHAGDRLVFEGEAVFGHFPAEALANQAGLAVSDDERQWLVAASPASIDLASFQAPPLLGREKLRMIDRISGYWPDGGPAGLGRIRAEKEIDPRQWFFKAHFFTDPVQPGSLGLEAVIQTLQAYMLARRCDEGFRQPRFEPVATAARVSWTYRGQVLPHNRKVTILLEVTDVGRDGGGAFAKAAASLWVDGMKIYALPEVGMRIVEAATGFEAGVELLDPRRDTWLRDHCPTYTIPVLPMMSVVDRLAGAAQRHAPRRKVLELRNVQLNGWIAFPSGPRRLKTSAGEKGRDELTVSLSVWRDAPHAALSRYDVLAHAEVRLGDHYPPSPSLMPPLQDAVLVHDPSSRSVYDEGELFHGPGFRFLTRLWRSTVGASFQLDSNQGNVPPGFLNQAILDGIAHGIPNENLRLWSDRVAADQVGYPSRVTRLSLFAEPPADGRSDCEVRFAGFHQNEDRFPQFAVQLVRDGKVWAEMELVYALFSKGPIGIVSGVKRRQFLEEKIYVPGVALGVQDGDATHVRAADIAGSDWLPGTVDAAFGLTLPDRVQELAVKQHIARSVEAHPVSVHVAGDFKSAVCSHHPLTRFLLKADLSGEAATVRFDTPPRLDSGIVRRFWEKYSGLSDWPIADLYVGAAQRFVRRVELTDPAGFESLRGKAAMFLANHQVGIESILFYVLGSALSQVPIKVLAKVEHRNSPVGQLIEIARQYPGVIQPEPILYFDRSNPASMLGLFDQFRRAQSESPASLMVHVEGTRATSCRAPVAKVSSVLLDLALQLQLPVVPVRFTGGLPVEPITEHLDFPFRLGRQDIRFGSPLSPDTLRALPLAERSRAVIQAINALAPEDEQPLPPEPMASRNVLVECLRLVADRSGETERLLEVIDGKRKPEGAWETDLAAWLTGMAK